MNSVLGMFVPSATTQIRMDHSHVLNTAQHYAADLTPSSKQALANLICVSLDIHARLEEEIFYPAMQVLESALVHKNVPEHDEMRQLIAELRIASPHTSGYDGLFHQLIRTVMRHVADEETMLLPEAERLLGDRLNDLGMHMAGRRMELVASRAPEIARDTLRILPSSLLLGGAGAMLAGVQALRYAMRRWT